MATPKHRVCSRCGWRDCDCPSLTRWLDQVVGLLVAIAIALLPDRITRRGVL